MAGWHGVGGDLWRGGEGFGVGDRRGDGGTLTGIGVGDRCGDGGTSIEGGRNSGLTSGSVSGSTTSTSSSTPPDGIIGETLGLVVQLVQAHYKKRLSRARNHEEIIIRKGDKALTQIPSLV